MVFKKGVDVIDLTDLEKRGILKRRENSVLKNNDFVELASNQETQQNPLGFLDTFANMASTENKPQLSNNYEAADVKVKLEEFEYKLERFLEKLEKIESKLEEFERNMHY
ncbi:hypothetical protein HY450_03765 [Candidatus Pacearchaeota archaeon]|nr:hypothetical protein [Candidatus Pacearchaeota archaeon]